MGVKALSEGLVPGWAEFGELYRDEAPRLAVFAVTLGASSERAGEVAHASLIALWRRWNDVPGTARTFARVLAVRANRVPRAGAAPAPAGPLQLPSSTRGHAVLDGLAQLPPRQRQVLAATFDDLPAEDVAQVLHLQVDAVESTVDVARVALEGLLDGRPAQPAYEELVAEVAEGMDLEAGLAHVAAATGPEDDDAPRPAEPTAGRRLSAAISDELVAAALTGDRDAVARLLEGLRPLVARYCRGKLGPVDRSFLSADDVAQEVCLAVLGALPTYRVQGKPFLAFVYGIAAHKVIDAHRAVSRGKSDPVADVPEVVAKDAGPEQQALRGELSAQLRELLDELPEKQREILLLRIVVGLSAEETAEIVGASAGAVRVAQHRALTRLRKSAPPSLARDQPH